MTDDCMAILAKMFPPSKPQPTLILVGHSMGGSVVVSLCHALSAASIAGKFVPRVAGVAVLDVVEGSAMAALSSMSTIVSALPKGFDSVEEAIRWHVDSGTIVNSQSARRSVPSLLTKRQNVSDTEEPSGNGRIDSGEDEAVEELTSNSPTLPQLSKLYNYTWRADLLATEPYWTEWFQGLSQSFLSVKCARLLVLAGTDRLDKDLMIGQMQGKYQLVVFADVGHSLQEDAPERTAQTLYDFWKRNESLDIKSIRGGLRKVGQP
jgi:protein phosphatase methylesterase 1